MTMIPLNARVAARASYLGLFVGLGLLGSLVGSWTLPVLAALVHGGFAEVHALTVVEFIFPGVPRFLSNELLKRHFPLPCMLLGMVGFAVFASAGARWWRRLVVARGWLTDAQAKAFHNRDDGF